MTYLYFYMARDWIYFDVVFWEMQLLYHLIPQGSSIPHDLLHHGLFLCAPGSGIIVDGEIFRRRALDEI